MALAGKSAQQLPMHLAVLLLFACEAGRASAQAWITGQIATNYGSAYDKMSPWQPSFGTLEVSNMLAPMRSFLTDYRTPNAVNDRHTNAFMAAQICRVAYVLSAPITPCMAPVGSVTAATQKETSKTYTERESKTGKNEGGMILQGSCGYGVLDKTEWPYWSVAGISVKSPFYIAGPVHACGCAHSAHACMTFRPNFNNACGAYSRSTFRNSYHRGSDCCTNEGCGNACDRLAC